MVSAKRYKLYCYIGNGVVGFWTFLRVGGEVRGCMMGTTTMLSINVFIYMLMQKGRVSNGRRAFGRQRISGAGIDDFPLI